MAQFERWFGEAVAAGVPEPNAMAVSTVGSDGAPSLRFVLLKGVDERGFQFFTNYRSRKGRELDGNPRVALAFRWFALARQGTVAGLARRSDFGESAPLLPPPAPRGHVGAGGVPPR